MLRRDADDRPAARATPDDLIHSLAEILSSTPRRKYYRTRPKSARSRLWPGCHPAQPAVRRT